MRHLAACGKSLAGHVRVLWLRASLFLLSVFWLQCASSSHLACGHQGRIALRAISLQEGEEKIVAGRMRETIGAKCAG